MSKELSIEIIKSRIDLNDKNIESIKSLNLYGLNLTEISLLNKFPLLEILSLSNNQIKDLSVLKTLKNLKELYLSNNQINEFNQLENLKNNKNLEKLILKGNPVCNSEKYFEKVINILPNLSILDEKEIKTEKNLSAPEPGKSIDIINQSFKKKKAEGKFIKIQKPIIKMDNDDSLIIKNKNIIKNEIIEDEKKFSTTTNIESVNLFENKKPGIGYHKKIVSKIKNYFGNKKLNESTYSNFNRYDNEEEEKKEDYKEKIFNRTFYKGFNSQTYNKKILDRKEKLFISNNNKKEERKERNKKIIKSIELLMDMLSLNGLKDIQNEIKTKLNEIKK